MDVSSTPTGADVYLDDHFFGRTPSTIVLRPGDHEIAIKKSGFIVWQKKFKLSSGRINVDAELVPKAK
jgi:PEGA domain